MTIQYQNNLERFARDYLHTVRALEAQAKQYQVIVRFTAPVIFHYSKWLKDNRSAEEHVVKALFFQKCNGTLWYATDQEAVRTVCYIPKFLRTAGYSFADTYLKEIEIVAITRSFSTQWAHIAASMRKYQINLRVAEAIEAHLRGEAAHITGFQNFWKETDRPRLMSFADVTGGLTIEQLAQRATKSAFGAYHVLHLSKDGIKRDRSIELVIRENGDRKFFAASEYAGGGNGDYYCLYSPSMAFYTETD